jgi:hypothetical protein
MLSSHLTTNETSTPAQGGSFEDTFSLLTFENILMANETCTPTQVPSDKPECADGAILPPELYLKGIFPLLTIEDVLALRQTCKFFCQLTRSNEIWKRFLRRSPRPHPPLFPDTVYAGAPSTQNVCNAELAVIRNVTANHVPFELQDKLRWSSVQIPVKRFCSMRMLPGGQHFVTVEEHEESSYSMSLWDIRDTNLIPQVHTRIRLPRSVPPEELDAIYTTFDGVYGVAMAVLQNDPVET